MRTIGFYLALLATSAAHASSTGVTYEAEWSLERHLGNADSAVSWIDDTTGHSFAQISTSLEHNGFGATLDLEQDSFELSSLFYDFETTGADWTIGVKPQEWSYAHFDSALNWIQTSKFVMREQYFSFGSWQLWCEHGDKREGCATRASGWLNQLDWQSSLGFFKHWEAALALQGQLGTGGLAYGELFYQEQTPSQTLQEMAPDRWRVTTTASPEVKTNLGFQWTFSNELTVHGEYRYMSNALSANDWQRVRTQLSTSDAALVADAFNDPASKHQAFFRINVPLGSWEVENASVVWLEHEVSVLNQLEISFLINDQLTFKTRWQHAAQNSLLAEIGSGNEFRITFLLQDGF